MPHISCLIPLYRSHAFFDIIRANIDAHLAGDNEILVCDRHGLDDTAARLAAHYAGEPRVRVRIVLDNEDWVGNISDLALAARGTYFRIVPHDDSASLDSSLRLAQALDEHPDAILAYGIVRAFDLDGNALPHLDQLNAADTPSSRGWTLDDALSLFWQGRFQGAFKGMIRTAAVQPRHLPIRKTPTLVCSERAWLFALALAGRFQFVPEAVLVKRYHPASTSSAWRYTAQVYADVAVVMGMYCEASIADPALRVAALRDIARNAEAFIARVDATRATPA